MSSSNPDGTQSSPEPYRKQNVAPLAGMNQFARWWPTKLRRIGPSDMDGWVHSHHGTHGDRFLFFELKTSNEILASMGGQLEALRALSRAPGMQCLVIFDPFYDDVRSDRLPTNQPLRVVPIRDGHIHKEQVVTLGRLTHAMEQWVWDQGPLAR